MRTKLLIAALLLAVRTVWAWTGSGTAGTPYQISTAAELATLAANVNGGANYAGIYFKLMNDVSLSSYPNWDPIGNSDTKYFKGIIDGNNKKITGLNITGTSNYRGLFGTIKGGCEIKNLTIENCNIAGMDYVGGLAGEVCLDAESEAITITNCHSSGTITVTVAENGAGGLIGQVSYLSGTGGDTYNIFITDCSSSASVSSSDGVLLGGLIGSTFGATASQNPRINKCYAIGNVTTAANYVSIGGLIGDVFKTSVSNCYARGNVSADGVNTIAAGLIGNNNYGNITNCYSTGVITGLATDVKGFIGASTNGTYTQCFWDKEVSGDAATAGTATGKTTTEMKTQGTFSGWDFTAVWEIVPACYPRLRTNMDAALPVELSSFTVNVSGSQIILNWQTATETNNYGFEVEKTSHPEQPRATPLGSAEGASKGEWTKIGFVEGNGTTNAPKSYSFNDKSASGKTSYRLKQIDRDGKFEYSQTVEVTAASTPKAFALDQNYPNPFNPTTAISYQLSANSFTTLIIYDAIGREAATLVSEIKEAGTYSVQFDGAKLSSGIYFAQLSSDGKMQIRKLMLMK